MTPELPAAICSAIVLSMMVVVFALRASVGAMEAAIVALMFPAFPELLEFPIPLDEPRLWLLLPALLSDFVGKRLVLGFHRLTPLSYGAWYP